MTAVEGLTAWCLRRAVRRCPAHQREERAREWAAELAALRDDPTATVWSRLWFAASLATTPAPLDGSDRGWRETASGLVGRAGLLLAMNAVAIFVAGLATGVSTMIAMAFVGPPAGALSLAVAVAVAVPAAGVGWWLGRRRPVVAGRPGRAGVAVAAAGALAFVLFRLARLEYPGMAERGIATASLIAGTITWAALMAGLLTVVGRGARRLGRVLALALLAVPVAIELATATTGLVVSARGGADAGLLLALAPMFAVDANPVGMLTWPDGALLYNSVSGYPQELLVLSVLAVAYTIGCAAAPATVAPPPSLDPAERRPLQLLSTRDIGLAVGGLVVALAAWAYAVAGLTPGITGVTDAAPMPGGTGELYLWASELRWTSILVAGLCLLVATAARRAGPLAAGLLVGMLLAADAALARAGVAGPGGQRLAVLVAAGCAAVAWWLAGPRRHGTELQRTLARRWLAVGAFLAAACGPLLLAQGTPTVNHPFLPGAQAVIMAAVPAVAVLLAGVTVLALRDRPLGTLARVVLLAAPALVVASVGAGTVRGVDQLVAAPIGGATAAALAAVVVTLLRRDPAPAWRWSAVTVGAGVAGIPLLYVYVYAAILPAETLFALAGTGYPADGLALLPGAALLVTPVALRYATRRYPTPTFTGAQSWMIDGPVSPSIIRESEG